MSIKLWDAISRIQSRYRMDAAPRRITACANILGSYINERRWRQTEIALRAAKEQAERGVEGERRLQLTVEDTGIGLPHTDVDQLFEKFTQGDSSITRRYGGAGLGLSICKSIVELMDGTIAARNRESGGCRWPSSRRIGGAAAVRHDPPSRLAGSSPSRWRCAPGADRVAR